MGTFFWKTYASLVGILTVISVAMSLFTPGILWIEYAPRIIIMVLVSIGLLGYVWKRPFLFEKLWRVVFWLFILVSVFVLWRNNHEQSWVAWGFFLQFLVGLLIALPLFVGLFRYAYRSSELWIGKTANRE